MQQLVSVIVAFLISLSQAIFSRVKQEKTDDAIINGKVAEKTSPNSKEELIKELKEK